MREEVRGGKFSALAEREVLRDVSARIALYPSRLKNKQFVLISYSAWQYIIRNERSLLHVLPSFVIVKPKEDDR